jgi:hypothetical protein
MARNIWRLLRNPFPITLLIAIFYSACGVPEEKTSTSSSTDGSVVSDGDKTTTSINGAQPDTCRSFDCFLGYSIERDPLEKWSWESQQPFVQGEEIFSDDIQALDKALRFTPYREIPTGLLSFIPSRKIKKADEYSSEIQDPYIAFKFYGFEKIRYSKYWLVGIFARKLYRVDSEYHEHFFLLITYTPDGVVIDDFEWWSIVDDDHQGIGGAGAIRDTLLIGHPDAYYLGLDEIHQKTILTEEGKFRTVYSNHPKSEL